MTTPQIAQGLASLGRGGDSVLVHMQPHEVAGLQAIARANGTSLTTNPHTGMPEAFSLGGFFKSLLPFAAGAALAPMTGGTSMGFMGTPLGMGLLGAGARIATGGSLQEGLMTGLGVAGGMSFGQGIMGAGAAPAGTTGVAEQLSSAIPNADQIASTQIANEAMAKTAAGAASTPGSTAFWQGTPTAVADTSSSILPAGAGYSTAQPGMAAQLTQPAQSGFQQFGQGIKNIANAESPWDAYKTAIGAQSDMGGLGKTASVLGPAVLAGIEPPEMMTQEEIEAQRRARFNRPLNLNEGSRLNLGTTSLASGGIVAFDNGGSVPGSKLNLRREEEQMAPMQVQPVQGAQPASIDPAQQVEQPAQTELGIAALKPGAENEVKIDIVNAQLDPMQQEAQQVQPLADRAQGEGIPQLMQDLGGQGVDFEKLYGRSQAPAAMAPRFAAPAPRGFGPDGRRLAAGGAIQSGGVMDLYQGADSQPTFGGDQGYGLGRLSNLAGQQAMARAEQGRFAKGGTPRLEDGGFVVPADVVFYMGNHNTEAGQKRLAKMYGAHPIKGPGTGLSDSIPTSIEGKEPAKIANGEAYIPRKVVSAHGGPQKFYKMMDKVRKKATGSTKQAKSA